MNPHDHEHEPIPGLPHDLPAGELIVWQGQPSWRAVGRHVFKGRLLAAYFAALLAIRAAVVIGAGEGLGGWLWVGVMALLFAAVLGFVGLMAWLHARTTIYTITTHRIVFRIGVALTTAWNLPFRRLASADLVQRDSGDGDIVLRLDDSERIGLLFFWPHTQPGHYLRPRPAMRALAEPDHVAAILGEAVRQWAAAEGLPRPVTRQHEPVAPVIGVSLTPEGGSPRAA